MLNTRTDRQRSLSRSTLTLRAAIFALVVCPIGSAAFATPSQTDSPRAQQVAVQTADAGIQVAAR